MIKPENNADCSSAVTLKRWETIMSITRRQFAETALLGLGAAAVSDSITFAQKGNSGPSQKKPREPERVRHAVQLTRE
jgi:hypothetical protein